MNIFKRMKDRTGNIIISVALLIGVTAPGFISTYVSAAQVTAKSIALSSSSADADNVNLYGKLYCGNCCRCFCC